MQAKWKIAITTHIVAAIFEILLIVSGLYELFKSTPTNEQGDFALTISILGAFFVHLLAGIYTAYCMHRYCNGRYFSLLLKKIYTAFLIFSLIFVILIIITFVAGLIQFRSTPGYEKTMTYYIIGFSVISTVFLWNLSTQIFFRRHLIRQQKQQIQSLIDSIGNPV